MSRPFQGVGISLRREHYGDILDTQRRADWLEIQPENFMGLGGWNERLLRECAERWTGVPHGVALSIGGPDPLSEGYLGPLAKLVRVLDPPYFSEHACYSSAMGIQFHDLLPLPFHDETVKHTAGRARQVVANGRPIRQLRRRDRCRDTLGIIRLTQINSRCGVWAYCLAAACEGAWELRVAA